MVPTTLHAQLFLLAYDRDRGRIDGNERWRFGLALRTAMLTDLYLTGHLVDDGGYPRRVHCATPQDSLLRGVLDNIGAGEPQDWRHAVARGQRGVPDIVRSDAEAHGWLRVEPRRLLGMSFARLRLYDDERVGGLATAVATAVHDAIAGHQVDQRLLALGLIGALGELPTVFSLDEATRHYSELNDLVDQAVPPIAGMRRVIESVLVAVEENTAGTYPG